MTKHHTVNANSKRNFFKNISAILLGLLVSALSFPVVMAATGDYLATPPFIAENTGKPNVIIALDISGSMKQVAYRDVGAGNWKTGLHDDFDPSTKYFGYFDSTKKYSYNQGYGFFIEDSGGSWDGNFLNWMAMRRMDVVRKVLVGGKVRDRNGEDFGGTTYYVLQGQKEAYDYSFRKSYTGSSAYTPFPDGQEFTMADGEIKPTTTADTAVTMVSTNMEVGRVTMDWSVGDSWKEVEFANTYTNPIVVAHAVSYNGRDPVVARVDDVGNPLIGSNGGFKIRLQEWDHKDGNHTTEDIIYMVAEQGSHSVTMDDSKTLEFVAGKVTTSKVVGATLTAFESVNFSAAMSATPTVFSGVSTYNEADAEAEVVTTRMTSISSTGFGVALQEQEANSESHVAEDIHYIAVVPVTGTVTATGVPIEVGNTGISSGNYVNDDWHTLNFSTTFANPPIVAMNMQTFEGYNTSSIRYGHDVHTETSIDLQIDEETSDDDETGHTEEDVGYFAVSGSGINIMIGLTEEPTGIIQDNTGGMRFGLAVYNYDHTKSPSSIYNGNTVDGGTLYPCYPNTELPLNQQTNYDICLETHVKAPVDNIIQVIEDHPLIWGTTPIAETLYEIYGYVAQHDNNRNGHEYYYDNGTETDHPGTYPSYKIHQDWDPYYYDEYSSTLECAKTFVLHFNDGAPFKDWDNTNPASIEGSTITDGVGSTAAQEMLDDVAYMLRKKDCRGSITGHQEIISYYVYAALGEGEINNNSTKRMRESAANGGFVDDDDDHEPDPSHPANFETYYDTFLGGGSCTLNEWDDDGDCSPDTFYLANDGYELVSELTAAFNSILRRASTGGAASVISASSSGEGAIFQAIFQTSFINGSYDVKWTGDLHGLFVDDAGLLREDDGDLTLEAPTVDRIVDMCFDEGEQYVRVKLSSSKDVSTSATTRPTQAQIDTCSGAVFSKTLFDIDFLWSGGEWLAGLTDAQTTAQRTYTSTANGRHIITGIDGNSNGLIDVSTEVKNFVPATFTDSNAGLLQAADATEAGAIVNYIRGLDQTGYRSREYAAGDTWRLGDIIYATPTTVGRPAESFDLLYGDTTYQTFREQYNDRRQVVYAGSNDGMLHAFNGGWYDAYNKKFEKGAATDTQYDMGAELWAYVPYNLLPHLKYITQPSYGQTTADHVYFVDLKPRAFDAKIFADDSGTTNIHPGGWGTVLVGGTRLGGGEITVDADTTAGTDSRTLRSSYFILDITDPDTAPGVLLEYTHPDLGFGISVPAPFIHNNVNYLLIGSGPDNSTAGITAVKSTQAAKLFLLNLNTMTLESSFGTGGVLTLGDANSFISDLIAVDYDLDGSSDAIYFGTVAWDAVNSKWVGKMYRIRTQDEDGTLVAVSSWSAAELYDAELPITAKPSIALDKLGNRWIMFGTGRYLSRDDAIDSSQQKFFGIKEPRNNTGAFNWGSAATLADVSEVEVEDVTGVLTGTMPTGYTDISPTFYELESYITQYSDSTKYVDGWERELDPAGDRVIGEATVLGGTLTHTSYEPSANACEVEGVARLHVNNFTTGTAGVPAIIGTDGTNSNGNPIIDTVIEIGVAPALTPSLHTGTGYNTNSGTKAFIQTSTGKIIAIEQDNADAIRSGERSWRQLK